MSTQIQIDRAAVIGAGVMGTAIAAHLANAGVPVVLLDIVASDGDDRTLLARTGVEMALKAKPAPFFSAHRARLITVGNLEDDLKLLADADLVVEAVVERMDIKRSLFETIAPHLKADAIVATNTSGLSVTEMAEALPEHLRSRFLGTHFFNPPRYLRLLELIPHAGTDADVLEAVVRFGRDTLGKGIVLAKDTPNFIGNRIGVFSMMSVIHAMLDGGYSVEEVDALTGPLIGRARSATFRTADLVGLDILVHAANTVYERATEDEKRDMFSPPEVVTRMVEAGRLGQKTGEGFFKKTKKDGKTEILTLDLETFEYRERKRANFGSVDLAKSIDDLGERLRTLVGTTDRVGEFLWRTLSETLVYSANRLGEISDDVLNIDRAMRWGFGWEMGPFETWDALGVEAVATRLEKDGVPVPAVVAEVLQTDEKTFYKRDDTYQRFYFIGDMFAPEDDPVGINLEACKASGGLVKKNAGASLVDIGDGILCLEFHSKMNAIGADIVSMVASGVKEVETNFTGLVIGNHGTNFSVGANIMLLLLEAQEGNWEEIDLMVRQFQKMTMTLKYCRQPVVSAPFGMTLGGGCEIALAAPNVFALAETYIGLVEVGVGLIPAGGGCKELLIRNLEGRPNVPDLDLFPYARATFETIGMAKVATSAVEAKEMKLLRYADGIAMNPDQLLLGAKAMALGLAAQGYWQPDPTIEIPVSGETGIAAIETQLYNMHEGGYISEYDRYLGGQLARVICGGSVPSGTIVGEQYMLDMEREVFLRLCGQQKSLERIQFMLKKGKPLRN